MNKEYYNKNRDKILAYQKEWRKSNKKSVSDSQKKYVENNKDRISTIKKKYEIENKEIVKKFKDNWRKNNPEYSSTYTKRRRKEDPAFRAMFNARQRVRDFLKNGKEFSKRLGCSFEVFKKHIESQFKPGMTWENYGEWHIDHIYPLSVAYGEGQESFAKACNYKNLQPLWANENLEKGDKIC